MTTQLTLPFFEVNIVDVEEEASATKALAEELFQEDQAEAVQAKMLFEAHHPVKSPEGSWGVGVVGGKKTTP